MIRQNIRKFLSAEMQKSFPTWDFSLTQEILPPTDTMKVNLYFPEETFSVFAEGPRVFESELVTEVELAVGFKKNKPAMEKELANVLQWLEKHRFLGGLALNSQMEKIETWEDYNGDHPLAYCRIFVRYTTHQNLLEAS